MTNKDNACLFDYASLFSSRTAQISTIRIGSASPKYFMRVSENASRDGVSEKGWVRADNPEKNQCFHHIAFGGTTGYPFREWSALRAWMDNQTALLEEGGLIVLVLCARRRDWPRINRLVHKVFGKNLHEFIVILSGERPKAIISTSYKLQKMALRRFLPGMSGPKRLIYATLGLLGLWSKSERIRLLLIQK